MNLNPKYLIYHDLIGLDVFGKEKSKSKVIKFSDFGKVIDESKNMLITEKNRLVKKYIKKDHIFRFNLPNFEDDKENYLIEVNGLKIVGLPENRLRNLKKKRRIKK
jgi:RNase P/RNase MRP subunit p29